MEKELNMNFTKICTADVDSPRQELSNGGLEIVAALAFFSGIDFTYVYTGGPIQLYSLPVKNSSARKIRWQY